MRKIILFAFLMSSFTFAQSFSLSFSTGDVDIDAHLSEVNNYAKVEYNSYKSDLSVQFGISEKEIDRYIYTEKISPGDLYFACALSSVSGKKVGDVIALSKKKKGWGAAAKELGIKPGSDEFHRLKSKSTGSIGKVKGNYYDNKKGKSKGKK